MTVTIWHNPACGTSRNTLAMIRASGEEPVVIEYLKEPPSRARLKELIAAMGITPRDLLREKGTPYAELGLSDPALSDDQLLDAMLAHPILINRPIVETPKGTRLCRPSEEVFDLLPRSAASSSDVIACDPRRRCAGSGPWRACRSWCCDGCRAYGSSTALWTASRLCWTSSHGTTAGLWRPSADGPATRVPPTRHAVM